MILKLREEHREIILNYVLKEPSINLFIIGDIEQYGFDKEYQEVWGKFDEANNLKGVLLRYETNFIPYVDDLDEDVNEFKQIIKSYKFKKIISGKSDIVQKFKDVLDDYKEKITYFCELRDNEKLLPWDDSVKIANANDSERVQDLLWSIEEFSVKESIEQLKSKISDNSKVVYYIENGNKEIITVSQVVAENTKSAMVVGVATREGYREQGYMSKCLSKLCSDFDDKGKSLCLFYDNPKAGRIYHKLGFNEIGMWTMLVEKI